MEQARLRRLYVAHATDWMDAVITILEPRSPYRPWHYRPEDEAQSGDTVMFVLDTDPPSILTDRVEVGTDGDLRSAVFAEPLNHATLMDVTSVAAFAGLETSIAGKDWFDGEDADNLELVLEDGRYFSMPESRFGHTSLAAARTLLRFWGRCDGCERAIDLSGSDARDQLLVHTTEQNNSARTIEPWSLPRDWPAVTCRNCFDRMADGGYASFVDFKFALHPPCPACGAHRTCSTFYGMPSDFENIEPWSYAGGCCVSAEEWQCSSCSHTW